MPERLLFALITTEIMLSLLPAELSVPVTLIFQFINVPRKHLCFHPLSKFRALSDFHAESASLLNTTVLHGLVFILRVHFHMAMQENYVN